MKRASDFHRFCSPILLASLASCGSEPAPSEGQAAAPVVAEAPLPAPPATPPPPPAPADPPFPAEATLVGLSGAGAGGAALVGLDGGIQRYVRPGAFLTPGWQLASVDRYGATFSAASGGERRLELPRSGPSAGESVASPPDTQEAPGKYEDERRARAQLAIQPFLKDGAVKGATISTPIADYPELRAGDVVTAMFGEPILGDEHMSELAAAMGRREGIKVTILRNGRTQTLSISPKG